MGYNTGRLQPGRRSEEVEDGLDLPFLAAVPELSAYDVATTARLASEGDRWLREHLVPDPHAAELVPWSIRGPDRLKADILAVRKMLAEA